MQETIIDLQTRLAYQEDSLEAVNLTVVRQQSAIEQLQKEILRLKEMIEDLRGTQGNEESGVELPPHY
ncbi:MAG: hypothetical protein BMS9Abin25_0779 [Gammaproteobacteria bacterium]|nr:MAG: hypothetical protein BMS9Abin25_0779 [Gammaproteobacteria bacterium]